MVDRADLYRSLLEALGPQEVRLARELIGSRTLREGLRYVVDARAGEARLFVPHYWAVYYHDGRGAVSPVQARKLVFFADPRDDPRRPAGPPRRLSEERRLTREEYLDGLEENARRRAAGQPPYMFVVDRVGPSRPRPFFDELARGAAARADAVAAEEFDRHVQELVDTDPALRPERRTISFG